MDFSVDFLTMVVSLLGTNTVTLAVSRYLNSRIQTETSDRWKQLANEYQSETARLRNRLGNLEETVAKIRQFYDAEIQRLKGAAIEASNAFNRRIDDLDVEIKAQAAIIENLTAANLKIQLALTIYISQLKAQGIAPVIDPARIGTMSLDELKLILEAQISAETSEVGKGREEKKKDDRGR